LVWPHCASVTSTVDLSLSMDLDAAFGVGAKKSTPRRRATNPGVRLVRQGSYRRESPGMTPDTVVFQDDLKDKKGAISVSGGGVVSLTELEGALGGAATSPGTPSVVVAAAAAAAGASPAATAVANDEDDGDGLGTLPQQNIDAAKNVRVAARTPRGHQHPLTAIITHCCAPHLVPQVWLYFVFIVFYSISTVYGRNYNDE
jgi:hypothetical protein